MQSYDRRIIHGNILPSNKLNESTLYQNLHSALCRQPCANGRHGRTNKKVASQLASTFISVEDTRRTCVTHYIVIDSSQTKSGLLNSLAQNHLVAVVVVTTTHES